jgi:hypothetical protein
MAKSDERAQTLDAGQDCQVLTCSDDEDKIQLTEASAG